jgi:hypothetical protein
MAILAADPIVVVKRGRLLRLIDIQGVANQAALVLLRRDVQNPAHSLADVIHQGEICFWVLILYGPGAVLVLKHCGFRTRLHAAVAARGTTRAGSRVLSRTGWLLWRIRRTRGSGNSKQKACYQYIHSNLSVSNSNHDSNTTPQMALQSEHPILR